MHVSIMGLETIVRQKIVLEEVVLDELDEPVQQLMQHVIVQHHVRRVFMYEIPVVVLPLYVVICFCVNHLVHKLRGDFVMHDLPSDHHVLFLDKERFEVVCEYVSLL